MFWKLWRKNWEITERRKCNPHPAWPVFKLLQPAGMRAPGDKYDSPVGIRNWSCHAMYNSGWHRTGSTSVMVLVYRNMAAESRRILKSCSYGGKWLYWIDVCQGSLIQADNIKRHSMPAILALCEGNPPMVVTLTWERSVMRKVSTCYDVVMYICLSICSAHRKLTVFCWETSHMTRSVTYDISWWTIT